MKEIIKDLGTNNLTKILSVNLYKIIYVDGEKENYKKVFKETYPVKKIMDTICSVLQNDGLKIVNIYEQKDLNEEFIVVSFSKESTTNTLNCNQIQIHTVIEDNIENLIVMRFDIEEIVRKDNSALSILNDVVEMINADIVFVDYHVRGFIQDSTGRKYFNDSEIYSMKDFINADLLAKYDAHEMNISRSNIYHLKLVVNKINIQDYIADLNIEELNMQDEFKIKRTLNDEILTIFTNKNS
ncbi:MAG: hypothetical protein RR738_08150 [Anaerorhabdus sp.]|uniref:hypothetical protein n=1 Tax=Anaerorhabdus sp. TaxID=1872524 RepID=UPI002FCB14E9